MKGNLMLFLIGVVVVALAILLVLVYVFVGQNPIEFWKLIKPSS